MLNLTFNFEVQISTRNYNLKFQLQSLAQCQPSIRTSTNMTFIALFVGECLKDEPRLFSHMGSLPGGGSTNTPSKCVAYCKSKQYRLAGVQYGSECWCGNEEPERDRCLPLEDCNMECAGDNTQMCGASYKMNIYSDVPSGRGCN